jgi:hypothetical protein
MRFFLSTAEALLHVFAPRLANRRLPLIVMLSLFVPAESFAEARVVDSRYIEFTGIHYFMWKRGAAIPPSVACAPVGYLTMKAPPYLDVEHCLCADLSRFSEQPNRPENPGDPTWSVLFVAYGDQDGDPTVCPWATINSPSVTTNGHGPDGPGSDTTAGSGVESELGSGSGPTDGQVSPQDFKKLGGCQSVSGNSCNYTTGEDCAARNTENAPGAPWQWCGASDSNPCTNKYIDQPPFELHVCM